MEGEFAGKLGFPLLIAWDWNAVQKGQRWDAIRDALRAWIASDEARNLPNGRHQITGAAGIPFRFDATKPARFGLDGVRFSRNDPKDTTFNERLYDQLAGRHKKLAVLGGHRANGKAAATEAAAQCGGSAFAEQEAELAAIIHRIVAERALQVRRGEPRVVCAVAWRGCSMRP